MPFFLLAAAGAALHLTIASRTQVISAAYFGSLQERLATALQVPFHYLWKTFWPIGLSAFYPDRFSRELLSLPVLAATMVLVAGAVATWRLRRRFPELLLGGGWFAITLLPVSNLFATSPVVADRYLFLPSGGLALLIAGLLCRLPLPRRRLAILVAVLLIPLGWLTVQRNLVWHSELSLWSDTVKRSPGVAAVWFNLGRAGQKTARPGLALEAYLRAISLDRANRLALDNAAGMFPASRGTIAERRQLAVDLAAKLPPYPAGLALLGYTPARWPDQGAVEELLLNLLAVENGSPELQLALANLYRQAGAVDRAAAVYNEASRLGVGNGAAELGLAALAGAAGDRATMERQLVAARSRGGVPETVIRAVAGGN